MSHAFVLPLYLALHCGHALALKQLARCEYSQADTLIFQGLACMGCAWLSARFRKASLVPRNIRLQAARLVIAGAALSLLTMSYWHVNAATVEMISSMDIALLILMGAWTGESYSPRQRALALASLALGALLVVAARGPAERVMGYGMAFLGTAGVAVGYLVLKSSAETENDSVTSFVAGLAILGFGFAGRGISAGGAAVSGALVAGLAGVMMFWIYELTLFLYRRMDIGSAEYPTLVSALLVLPLERALFATRFNPLYVFSIVANAAVLGLALFNGRRDRVCLLRPVPPVRQSTPITCGPASLDSVLRYWGKASPGELALSEQLGTLAAGVTRPEELAHLARRFGLDAELRERLQIEDLEGFLRDGETAIVIWNDDGGHYSVLTGIDDAHVHLMDPWPDPAHPGTYRSIPIGSFRSNWHGQYCRRAAIRIKGDPIHGADERTPTHAGA